MRRKRRVLRLYVRHVWISVWFVWQLTVVPPEQMEDGLHLEQLLSRLIRTHIDHLMRRMLRQTLDSGYFAESALKAQFFEGKLGPHMQII